MAPRASALRDAELGHRNDVVLVGRLGAPAEHRTLPSGEEIVTFRLVIDRPAGSAAAGGRQEPRTDTLDCSASRASVRRRLLGWRPGDIVQVDGALRRRFWRSAGRVLTRSEVHVTAARRLARSG